MAAPPEWMPPELYEKMHAAFERARAERLDMELAQAAPHEESDPRTRANTGAFLILESERRAIAARLRRHYWRLRDRYRDLDAITKLTQLEYEHLAGRLGHPNGPPLGGDSPADWAESWGSGPMLEMGTAFIFYRGQRDRLGRRLPVRTRTRVDADVSGYGIGVSRAFQKAMGEWTPDLEPESIWPASKEQRAELTAAQAAGATGAATAAWRQRRLAWPRTATTAAAVVLAAGAGTIYAATRGGTPSHSADDAAQAIASVPQLPLVALDVRSRKPHSKQGKPGNRASHTSTPAPAPSDVGGVAPTPRARPARTRLTATPVAPSPPPAPAPATSSTSSAPSPQPSPSPQPAPSPKPPPVHSLPPPVQSLPSPGGGG
jgi:hypothetical protein